ncbi:MAG: hypothetical protein UH853_09400, partial [Muribaculaceae bacterium]|nr:hypothetical protein [Muribaculaceae bacterium]
SKLWVVGSNPAWITENQNKATQSGGFVHFYPFDTQRLAFLINLIYNILATFVLNFYRAI